MAVLSLLDRQRTIASPGFNRWLIPPAALSIHLAIGQAYAFSVFNLPLARTIGIDRSAEGDWKLPTVNWIFSIAIFLLGTSAALFGAWLERAGPRKAMLASACCFGGGFLVSALGVHLHIIWLLYLGYGVIGGIGLGLGYIAPVSTLIKWFPDRPGMATGLAIMGFGGGAMIGSPLGVMLMQWFATPTSTGVAETFVVMGAGYFVFMMFGVICVRLPPPGWKPAGFVPSVKVHKLITTASVTASQAIKTPQFYLLWLVLFLNVSAGIGLLGKASELIQEMFLGVNREAAATAAGFVGLLSLFNMGGRFFWSSISDYLGRKATYAIFFLLGAALFALIPTTRQLNNVILFVGCCAVLFTMYGGGFATIPAYLRDLFGVMQVGAIHGRLLTAWSMAGIAGPNLVNLLRSYQLQQDIEPAKTYDLSMYFMAGLLLVGAVGNFLVTAVHSRHHDEPQPDRGDNRPMPPPVADEQLPAGATSWSAGDWLYMLVSWLWVGVPLAWGVSLTIDNSLALFKHAGEPGA